MWLKENLEKVIKIRLQYSEFSGSVLLSFRINSKMFIFVMYYVTNLYLSTRGNTKNLHNFLNIPEEQINLVTKDIMSLSACLLLTAAFPFSSIMPLDFLPCSPMEILRRLLRLIKMLFKK